jgi:hypothetical protein
MAATEFDEHKIVEFINGIVQDRSHPMTCKYQKRGTTHPRKGSPPPRQDSYTRIGDPCSVFQILFT